MIYLLNSPLLTNYGQWEFTGPLNAAQARQRLAPGFQSAIGHPATAHWLAEQLGLPIPCERREIHMQPGDTALVVRLTQRLAPGTELGPAALAQTPIELGWLERSH